MKIADAEASATPDSEYTMVTGETPDLTYVAETEADLHCIEEIVDGRLEHLLWHTPTPIT